VNDANQSPNNAMRTDGNSVGAPFHPVMGTLGSKEITMFDLLDKLILNGVDKVVEESYLCIESIQLPWGVPNQNTIPSCHHRIFAISIIS